MKNCMEEAGSDGFFINPPWGMTVIEGKQIFLNDWIKKINDTLPHCKKGTNGWVILPIYDPCLNDTNITILESRTPVRKLLKRASEVHIITGFSYKIIDHENGGYKNRANSINPTRTMALWISNSNINGPKIERINLSNNQTVKISSLRPSKQYSSSMLRFFFKNQKFENCHDAQRKIENIFNSPLDNSVDLMNSRKGSFITIKDTTSKIDNILSVAKSHPDYFKNFILCPLNQLEDDGLLLEIFLTSIEFTNLRETTKNFDSREIIVNYLSPVKEKIDWGLPLGENALLIKITKSQYENINDLKELNRWLKLNGLAARCFKSGIWLGKMLQSTEPSNTITSPKPKKDGQSKKESPQIVETTTLKSDQILSYDQMAEALEIFGQYEIITKTSKEAKINFKNPLSYYLCHGIILESENGSLIQFQSKLKPKRFEEDWPMLYKKTPKERLIWAAENLFNSMAIDDNTMESNAQHHDPAGLTYIQNTVQSTTAETTCPIEIDQQGNDKRKREGGSESTGKFMKGHEPMDNL